MQFLKNNKNSIFILGPDNKMLVRDALTSNDFFYFNPDTKEILWNFEIIFFTLIYFLQFLTIKSSLKSLIKSAYLTALINVTTKEAAITAIDNNPHYWRAARILHKKIKFITIQNGTKFYSHKTFFSNINEMFVPELLCYGHHDREKLDKSLATVKNYYPVGSLYEMKAREVSDLYKAYRKGSRSLKYDLCLISEDYTNWNSINPGIEEVEGKIAELCYLYCKQNNLKLVIALKNQQNSKKRQSEINFYSRFIDLKDPIISLSQNDTWWSSYDIAIESQVSIGMASSLLVENASRGLKVLICDFYGLPWSLGTAKPLSLVSKDYSYQEFSDRVDCILSQSDEEYYNERKEQINYLISMSETTTSECINSILSQS